ncbi:hypothetical protein BP5796_06229 [Coleophoma crateriformis]|uniref:FAD dependent oxidoreductase domain-containing protein n=1 Tax=Coleophoma crateriformis TaxID=565419 RepID=A0A3D8RWF7_9HELO|nr:hypothetical protein BP5796_06229 [Coleophoma crateriformis]
MGVVQSALRNVYLSISTALGAIAEMNADFNLLLARINASPGLPVSDPTSPFWLSNPPFPALTKIQSKKLPTSADIVIIGSGITGTSIAMTILEESKAMGIETRVVMLEAREITSGATGRNGGHIKTAPYELFYLMKEKLGVDQAKKIVQYQMILLDLLPKLAKEKGWHKAEARKVETVDLFFDDKMFEKARQWADELRIHMPEYYNDIRFWDAKEAQEKFQTGSHLVGALTYTAGAIWPFRFVTSCLSYLLESFTSAFSVETSTPVTSITMSEDPSKYIIHTPRGNINTKHVIHATEAHTANLIPKLRGKLFAVRGHMSAQRPGKLFPQLNGDRSWGFIHAKGYEYITQRPGDVDADSDGLGAEIMTGGGLRLGGNGMDEVGVAVDNSTRLDISSYLGGVLPTVFGSQNWGEDAARGRMKGDVWTGTMGFSADGFPFVGKLDPSLTGRKANKSYATASGAEWVSAGYGGEGMPQAWLCGCACALMVLGRDKVDLDERSGRPGGKLMDWFPEQMIITPERVSRANINELASEL